MKPVAARRGQALLRLGTRASPLALAQARWAAAALERAHRARGLRVLLVPVATAGDRDRRTALSRFSGSGLFVKELELALLDGGVDCVVHSLKDLPLRQPRGLSLAAVARRADTRDVLAAAGKLLRPRQSGRAGAPWERLPPGALIGCGSPRRRAQLAACLPNLRFAEIRGNVGTRLAQVAAGRYAATVLARAGLERLGWRLAGRGWRRLTGVPGILLAATLPLELILPAPGQGALGLECRAGDRRTRRFLRALHHAPTGAAVAAERACLGALGGGCHLPLGALGSCGDGGRGLRLRAVWFDGKRLCRAEVQGTPRRAVSLGRLAARRLKAESRAHLKGQGGREKS